MNSNLLLINQLLPDFKDDALQQTINAQTGGLTTTQPILFWNVLLPQDHEEDKTDDAFAMNAEYIHYLLYRKINTSDSKSPSLNVDADWFNALSWSCPMRIKVGDSGGSRQNVILPLLDNYYGDENEGPCTQLLAVSTCCERDVTFISLTSDAHAQIMLHNHTPYALYFGQSYTDDMQPGMISMNIF